MGFKICPNQLKIQMCPVYWDPIPRTSKWQRKTTQIQKWIRSRVSTGCLLEDMAIEIILQIIHIRFNHKKFRQVFSNLNNNQRTWWDNNKIGLSKCPWRQPRTRLIMKILTILTCLISTRLQIQICGKSSTLNDLVKNSTHFSRWWVTSRIQASLNIQICSKTINKCQ